MRILINVSVADTVDINQALGKLLNYGKNIGPMGATCGLGDIFYTASLAPDVENDTIT